MDFGYKHLLQRHLAKFHSTLTTKDKDNEDESGVEGGDEEHEDNNTRKQTSPRKGHRNPDSKTFMDIDTILGKRYSDRAQQRLASHQGVLCPFPHLPMDFLLDSSPTSFTPAGSSTPHQKEKCEYVFSRAYDFRRHLRATHGVEVEKEKVERWVRDERSKI